jgi:hypothetical protein
VSLDFFRICIKKVTFGIPVQMRGDRVHNWRWVMVRLHAFESLMLLIMDQDDEEFLLIGTDKWDRRRESRDERLPERTG